MKKLLCIVLVLTFCLTAPSALAADGVDTSNATYVLTYSTPLAQTQSSTIFFDKALDKIEEETNGDVTFTRTYSGTLGSEHDLGVMVTNGDIDITCVGPGQWSDWDEAFKVFDCPFAFVDFDHFDRFIASEDYQNWLTAHGDPLNLKFVVTFNQAFKGILNKERDVYSTEDLAGLKLRVPDSASLIEIGNAMGYTATPTAAADQYTSLSQGIVDGADHALWAHESWKLTEIAKHYSETNHALQLVFFVMNKDSLAELPEEYQKIVLDAFAECEKDLAVQTRKDAEDSYAIAEEDGVKIIPYSEIDVDSFKTALQPIIDEYSQIDPELYGIIQATADAE